MVQGTKQPQTRLTPAQVDELALAYQAGDSVPQVAAQFGIHRTTVLDHLKRRGVPRRPAVRKLTDAQVQEAYALHRAGHSLASLCRELGVSDQTLRKEFGIQRG